jgi:hypothetical protein
MTMDFADPYYWLTIAAILVTAIFVWSLNQDE